MVRLNEEEKQIVGCMFFRADMSLRDVAEETGLREHVVRRRLGRLLEEKIVAYRPFVNPFAVGLSEYLALISTPLMSPEVRQQLISYLIESKYTTYVAVVGGEYHLSVMFVARDQRQVMRFFDELNSTLGGAPYDISVTSCLSVSVFAPSFLNVAAYGPPQLTYGVTEKVFVIDALDDTLLRTIASSPTLAASSLAREAGVPLSTVNYRLAALREKGVFCGFGLTIPPFNDGLFAYSLQIHAAGMPESVRETFFDYCERHPNVSSVIHGVGGWNFMVSVRLTDTRQVTVIADQFQRTFAPHVTKVGVVSLHECRKLSPHPLSVSWSGSQGKRNAG